MLRVKLRKEGASRRRFMAGLKPRPSTAVLRRFSKS